MVDEKALQREVLQGFWKAHILHHAATAPVVGQWMMRELRRHGYEVSPGTLYPLLARLEERGWLACSRDPAGGRRARKEYTLTPAGREALAAIVRQVCELHEELVPPSSPEERPK
ncbi:MAG TPA: PadR family transcriptional regulator [Chthonomonadales bacterium]|nr:PadR family transcriptional regulator [Chthonomonadales bacterium]